MFPSKLMIDISTNILNKNELYLIIIKFILFHVYYAKQNLLRFSFICLNKFNILRCAIKCDFASWDSLLFQSSKYYQRK